MLAIEPGREGGRREIADARRRPDLVAVPAPCLDDDLRLDGDCQEFRVRACIVGSMEIPHGTTERTGYPGRDP